MGMYTKIVADFDIKPSSKEVVETLQFMINGGEEPPHNYKHPLFCRESRWVFMLCCDSYYHAGDTHSSIRYDDISRAYTVSIKSNLKNYTDEIKNFFDWVAPHVDGLAGDYLGYEMYEEDDHPSHFYFLAKYGAVNRASVTLEENKNDDN